MFDSVVVMLGEIRCLSLRGIKGLRETESWENRNRNIVRFSTVKFLISINGFLQAKSNFSQRVIKNVSQCFFFLLFHSKGLGKEGYFSI